MFTHVISFLSISFTKRWTGYSRLRSGGSLCCTIAFDYCYFSCSIIFLWVTWCCSFIRKALARSSSHLLNYVPDMTCHLHPMFFLFKVTFFNSPSFIFSPALWKSFSGFLLAVLPILLPGHADYQCPLHQVHLGPLSLYEGWPFSSRSSCSTSLYFFVMVSDFH